MNKLLLVLILLLSNSVFALELVLVDSPIGDFVQWTAKQTKKNIILSDSIKGNISVNAKNLNKSDLLLFFKETMTANGYQVVEAATSLIVTIDEKPDLKNKYFTLETKLYHFENIEGERALDALETMMFSVSRDDSGSDQIYKIMPLNNGNGVVVTTTKELHASITRFLPQIDVSRKLILIEAIIVEKQINDNQELGVDFNIMPGQQNGINFKVNDLNINPASGFLSLLNNGNIVAMIHALETQDNIDILSKPKLMTLDRQTAQVIVGQDVPFVVGRTITDNDTSKQFQQIERRDVGLVLKITPYIVGNTIHLKINQSISSVSASTQAADLITNKRSIDTVVSVKTGQMVTLGGLISKTSQDTVSGVPLLQDIPFIGGIFQSTSTETKKTELSLIVKARII
jgi:general secretion pathway protein D